MKTLEERYWDIWTKDDDLTHIDDQILKFIKKEIRRRERELIEEFQKITRLEYPDFITFTRKDLKKFLKPYEK